MDLWYTEITNETHGLTLKVKRPLYHGQTEFQTIDILETWYHGNLMVIDGVVMLTERDEFIYHESIAHVPMQLLEKPERVLIIGGGDGGTAREILKYPSVEEVVMVEIDAGVVEASKRFFPGLAVSFKDPKLSLRIMDGAKFVKDSAEGALTEGTAAAGGAGKTGGGTAEGPKTCRAFDLVIVDSTDPVGPGEVLFSEEFYRDCGRILKPGGAFVAQTESPFDAARRPVINKIYKNLKAAFSKVSMYLASIPNYPFGIWSFTFSSNAIDPLKGPFRAASVPGGLKYYNRELGRGVFMLPNYVREIIDERVP
jgi:spermidine synthase